jgi:hypothetical protein
MSQTIKISDKLYCEAKIYAQLNKRSIPKQIEFWSEIGKIAEENPDLTYEMIGRILLSKAELDNLKIEDYNIK